MVLRSATGQKRLPRLCETFLSIMQRIDVGSVDIVIPDRRVFKVEGKRLGLHGRLEILNEEFFSRIAREGENGFAEMYMDGWWTTPDLQALLDILILNNDNVARGFPGAA